MTMTKRQMMPLLAQMEDDGVIYVDNGVDSVECKGAVVVGSPADASISTNEEDEPLPGGSLVLFAH